MISALISQYIQAFGAAGMLWAYLVLHLCAGIVLPYRKGAKPLFFRLMENIGLDVERRLNRETRPQPVRFIRGAVVAFVLGLGGFLAGYAIHLAAKPPHGWIAELFFLSLCISFMTPLKLVRRLLRHLRANETVLAAEALQPYLKTSLEKADAATITRKAIEFIAVSLNQFLMAPAFWFLLTGPVGLSLYITYAALYQAFGLPDERRKYFSRCVRIIDTLMNIVPALLTALILVISALFVSKSNPLRGLVTMLRQGGRYHTPYSGWPMAAIAGGLGVTLGGPVRYSSEYMEEHIWIGPEGSSARLTPEDLARSALLQYVFFVCLMGLNSTIMILAI